MNKNILIYIDTAWTNLKARSLHGMGPTLRDFFRDEKRIRQQDEWD